MLRWDEKRWFSNLLNGGGGGGFNGYAQSSQEIMSQANTRLTDLNTNQSNAYRDE